MNQHQHQVEEMMKVKEQIDKLNQKRIQFQGAIQTLKTQESEIINKIKMDYNMNPDEFSQYLAKESTRLENEEKQIINTFENMISNEFIQSYLKIQRPFTIEAISNEIQNNLMPLKSQLEGQMKSLEQQQESLRQTISNDFNIEFNQLESYLESQQNELNSLEQEIQNMYNHLLQDEELRTLLQ